jgi:hypothetical protein
MVLSLPPQLVFPGTATDLTLVHGSLTEREGSAQWASLYQLV